MQGCDRRVQKHTILAAERQCGVGEKLVQNGQKEVNAVKDGLDLP